MSDRINLPIVKATGIIAEDVAIISIQYAANPVQHSQGNHFILIELCHCVWGNVSYFSRIISQLREAS